MQANQTWMEQMQMRHHQTEQQLKEWLGVFVNDCRCRGTESHESLQNAMRHFNDWLRIQLTKNKSKGNGHGNGNTDSRADAQRRLVEYAAVAAEFRQESYNDLAARGEPPE